MSPASAGRFFTTSATSGSSSHYEPSAILSICTNVSESESEVAQSCLTLFDPMDCSLPGSSVCGILQAKILDWVAISFSRGSY